MREKVTLEPGLYVLTEHQRLDFTELLGKTSIILRSGIAALQYRNKQADRARRLHEAGRLQALCREFQTPFLINDDVDLALELNADGVHIGKDEMSCLQAREYLGDAFVIGVSCYNDLQRVRAAVAEGADYIALGAMFPSSSKADTVSATPALIHRVKQEFDIPVAAIGGITPENCLPLLDAGTDLLAVISSVYSAIDPRTAVQNFNKLIKEN